MMILPETSRELVIEILENANFDVSRCADWVEDWTAIIEAWVRVRIADAVRAEAEWSSHKWGIVSDHDSSTCSDCARMASANAALAKARKEFEPKRMQPAGEANDRS